MLTKIKKSKYDQTQKIKLLQKIKLWQNLKQKLGQNYKNLIVTMIKISNCDKTQKQTL